MGYPKQITKAYLRAHPEVVFVFGDNLLGWGTGGAAVLRYEPNTYGFVTKKAPDNNELSFYTPMEYKPVFDKELRKLVWELCNNPEKTYLISPVGAGLANRHNIWEKVIKPGFEEIRPFPNIVFLWEV